MKQYLLTLLFICALSSAILYLSTGSRYEKYLRYLCALLTLLALISPLPSLLSSITDFQISTKDALLLPSSDYADSLKRETEQQLCKELTSKVSANCKLAKDDFFLQCHLSLDKENALLSFDAVSVELYSLSAVAKREEIRETLLPFCQEIEFTEKLK